jgi:sRNA-binding carbon storage regulator CsrA
VKGSRFAPQAGLPGTPCRGNPTPTSGSLAGGIAATAVATLIHFVGADDAHDFYLPGVLHHRMCSMLYLGVRVVHRWTMLGVDHYYRRYPMTDISHLSLTRKIGEKIIVGTGADRTEILVTDCGKNWVRLLFSGPRSVPIMRSELLGGELHAE